MKKFSDFKLSITEGVYDKNILKVFFLAGGPGSGKSFVTRNAFAGTGLKTVDSDKILTKNLQKANLSLKMPDEESYFKDIIRKRAKVTMSSQITAYTEGRLGFIIDGTARDYDEVARQFQHLTSIGYDCHMIFVNTSLDVALERNAKRARTVPEYVTRVNWEGVQRNIGKYQRLFGAQNFIIIDNNKDEQELVTLTIQKATRAISNLLRQPVRNWIGKSWIAKELLIRKKM